MKINRTINPVEKKNKIMKDIIPTRSNTVPVVTKLKPLFLLFTT